MLLVGAACATRSDAQGTAFTYQGQLTDSAGTVNGAYDLRFALFDAEMGGNQVGPPLTNTPVAVANGLFTTTLDFGAVFNGAQRWLEISARRNGLGSFTIVPRQRVTATPHAIFSANAGTASSLSGTLPASQISGTLAVTQLPAVVVTNNETGVNLSGSFGGDGGSLTNLLAGSLKLSAAVSLGHIDDGGSASGVAVSGNIVYLANGDDGLRVYNIANPGNPVSIGHVDEGGVADYVAVSGNFAYLANSFDGLRVYNIANPTNPVSIGHIDDGGSAIGVAVSGNFAYLANYDDGLRVYNIANPTNPVSIGHINDGGLAFGVAVSGHFAYLANLSDGLRVYNIANPTNPVSIGHINDGGAAEGVTVSGNFAYLANFSDGLRVYNIANPTNLVGVGHINDGLAFGVAVSGNFAYLANNDDGLRIYNIANPTNPVNIGHVDDGGLARGVAVSGNFAYLANNSDGLRVYAIGAASANFFQGDGRLLTGLNGANLQDSTVSSAKILSVDASRITSGTLAVTQLPAVVVTNNQTGVNLTGTLSGDGAGMTNVNLVTVNSQGAIGFVTNYDFLLASSPSVGLSPESVTAADVNGDGKVDLISANSTTPSTLSVLTNNGNDGFVLSSSPGVGSHPSAVAAADVNGDGKADLVSANRGASTLSVLTNNGNGGFVLSSSPSVGGGPVSVTAADVNGDGKVDLVSANGFANTLSVLTNNGNGGYVLSSSPGVGSIPVSVAAADVNGDGKVDLISANNDDGTLSVLTNNSSGGFVLSSSPPVGGFPGSVVAADVNGDGKVDLISANSDTSTLSVLTNNGNGGFVLSSSPGVGIGPVSVAASDVNGDGKIDLISANRFASTLSVLTNNGNGGFGLAASPGVGSGPVSVATADVNGDGTVDLISANSAATLSVLFNTPNLTAKFHGDGSSLTALNADNISSGMLADARLSDNVALRAGGNSFTGDQSITAGNLGIGVVSPTERLVIAGASPKIRVSNTAETEASLVFADADNAANEFARIAFDASGTTDQNLNFYVDGPNAVMTVKGNQRVGIGTSSPATALDVNGTVTAASFSGSGSGLSGVAQRAGGNSFTGDQTFTSGSVGIGTSPTTALEVNGTVTASTFSAANGLAGTASYTFQSDANTGLFHPSADTVAVTTAGTERMRFDGSGRVGIGTTTPALKLTVSGSGAFNSSAAAALLLTNTTANGHGWEWHAMNDGRLQLADFNAGASGTRIIVDTNGNVAIGDVSTVTNKLHVEGSILCSSLVQTSDRNAKENFQPVSPEEVLAQVTELPISRWNFKAWHDGQHLGPMAQDFYAAFKLGGGETTITALDAEGVALAAIQGLNKKVEGGQQQSEKRIQDLEQSLEQKEAEVTELRWMVKELKEAVEKLQTPTAKHHGSTNR